MGYGFRVFLCGNGSREDDFRLPTLKSLFSTCLFTENAKLSGCLEQIWPSLNEQKTVFSLSGGDSLPPAYRLVGVPKAW